MSNGNFIPSSDVPDWLSDPNYLRENHWNTVLGNTDKTGLTMDVLLKKVLESRTIADEMRNHLLTNALLEEGARIQNFVDVNKDVMYFYELQDTKESMEVIAAYNDDYAGIRAPWIEFYQGAVASGYVPPSDIQKIGESLTADGVYSLTPKRHYMRDELGNLQSDGINDSKIRDIISPKNVVSTDFVDKISENLNDAGKTNRALYDWAIEIADRHYNRLRSLHRAEDRLDHPFVDNRDPEVHSKRLEYHDSIEDVQREYDASRKEFAGVVLELHSEWVSPIDESVWYRLGQLDKDGYLSSNFDALNFIDIPKDEVPMSNSMLSFSEYEARGNDDLSHEDMSNLPDISRDRMAANGITQPDWSKSPTNPIEDIAEEIYVYERESQKAYEKHIDSLSEEDYAGLVASESSNDMKVSEDKSKGEMPSPGSSFSRKIIDAPDDKLRSDDGLIPGE